jgi:hypothetical protein
LASSGGAIACNALTATDSTFTLNMGGAIRAYGPTTLTRCEVSLNSTYSKGYIQGGGLSTFDTLLLDASTISANVAYGIQGYGGFYPSAGGGISALGPTTIRNSTISGNSAGGGGGVYASPYITLVVQNSTITGNTADYYGGGGIWGGAVNLESAIIANNSALSGREIRAATVNAKTSSVFNLTGIANFYDPGGNRPAGEDPLLGPLQNNGGPTMTRALLPNSPCVDVGSNPANQTNDQRGPGFPRVLNGKTDMGAHEGVDPIPIVTPVSMPAITLLAGGTTCDVVVRYHDGTGIDLAAIDLSDIAVTGPGYAAPQMPIARAIAGSGKVVTVTYTLPAPGGAFDYLDDGQYSVGMVGNQVGDTDIPVQHFVAAGSLGTFRVSIPIPGPLVVDEPSDIEDTNSTAGHLSLREAIRIANGSLGTSDTITFSPAVFNTPRTLSLAAGEFAVTDPVTLKGPGAGLLTLNAGGESRVFDVALSNATSLASISGLTMINGFANATYGAGGAILANAKLAVSDVVISNCKTSSNGGGGGIYASAGLTLSSVAISDCAASAGGGVCANGDIVIERSSFVNNVATYYGGGLRIVLSGLTMQISDSAIVGNSLNLMYDYTQGGGIFITGDLNSAGSFIRNSTISGNIAGPLGIGGGISMNMNGTLPIANSTITDNIAAYGGGISGYWDVSVILSSTIIAGNLASYSPDLRFGSWPTIISNNCLIGIADTGYFTLTGAGNLTGTLAAPLNPMLAPLANNGGPTKTHALLPGSPAIDNGNNSVNLTNDQRGPGFVRVFNGKADIGALEVQPVTPPAKVSSVQVNDGSAQRSRVTELSVTFTTQVTFAGAVGNAFTLTRNGGGPVNFSATASVFGDVTVVTLTGFTGSEAQFGSLGDGRYTLTALASQIIAGSVARDGNGDGTPGDNYVLIGDPATNKLFRLFGDADGNGAVNSADFALFRNYFGVGASIFDFNNDGQTNSTDFAEFRKRYGITLVP